MLRLYLPKGSVIIHSPWWILCLFISKHPFNSLFPNSGIHFPHCSVDISSDTDKENLFDNQESPLLIISFILISFIFNSRVII